MSKITLNIGTSANDGTGDPLRSAGSYINTMMTDLYNYGHRSIDLNAIEISDDDDLLSQESHFIITRATNKTFFILIYNSNKTAAAEGAEGSTSRVKIFDYPSMVLHRTIDIMAGGLSARVYRVGDVIRCTSPTNLTLYARDINIVGDDPDNWTLGDEYTMSMTMLNSSGNPESLPVTAANIQTHLEQYFGDTYAGYNNLIPTIRNMDKPALYGGNLYTVLELNGEFTSNGMIMGYIIRSTDSGVTWSLWRPINYTTTSRKFILETSLVFIGSVLHTISRTGSSVIEHNSSADLGTTWTTSFNINLSTIATKPVVINYYLPSGAVGVVMAVNITDECGYTSGSRRTTMGVYTTSDFITFNEIAKIVSPSYAFYPSMYHYSGALWITYTKGLKYLTDAAFPTSYDRNTIVASRVY